ncbi:unnamed protein product [Ranitomeya imitator]|uniref:Uncharacterized protein n=1 Tax=Ranitomeya imitator TaxID=111125 RepID=A0ABN9KZE7_9NEOB|nr:unnamed protein product [Ranitomeya imitator]
MRSTLLLCAFLLLLPGSPARQIQHDIVDTCWFPGRRVQTFMLDSVLKLKHFLDGFGNDMEAAAKDACHSFNPPRGISSGVRGGQSCGHLHQSQ